MDAVFQSVQNWVVFVFLISTVGAVGLTLEYDAILAQVTDLKLVLRAVALNFIIAPAFAWLLTCVIPLEQGHVVGLLLLGGSAGAPFLPKLVETARGDVALSGSLVGLLTAGTIIFLPFALPLMIPSLSLAACPVARPLLLLILLPLGIGVLIRGRALRFSERAAPVLAKLGNIALLLLLVLLVGLNGRLLIGAIGSGAILATLLFFAGLLAFGWTLGGATADRRIVLSLATAARNFGAALVPAATSFTDPAVTVMIIVGAVVCLAVTFVGAAFMQRVPRLVPSGV